MCVVGVCLGSAGGRMWSGSLKWSESVYRRSADVYGNGVEYYMYMWCGVGTIMYMWLEITTFVVPAALNAPPSPPPNVIYTVRLCLHH